jgi:hypothetical protein
VGKCACGLISCVCDVVAKHARNCRFRRAALCPVAFECDEHGFDVCPTCDPCTCGAEAKEKVRITSASLSLERRMNTGRKGAR